MPINEHKLHQYHIKMYSDGDWRTVEYIEHERGQAEALHRLAIWRQDCPSLDFEAVEVITIEKLLTSTTI